jgi:hypothetical protein
MDEINAEVINIRNDVNEKINQITSRLDEESMNSVTSLMKEIKAGVGSQLMVYNMGLSRMTG